MHQGKLAPASGTVKSESEAALTATVARLRCQSVVFDELPARRCWLWTEVRLRDPAGNPLILYWAGENRLNPPWWIPDTA